LRGIRQERDYKELKPQRLEEFMESQLSTQASENGYSAPATPKTITSVTTIGEEEAPLFDKAAQRYFTASKYHRSANGRLTPRRSPIKIKKKIITKRRRLIPERKIRIWLANHQQAIRKMRPGAIKQKRMNEGNFAAFGPITMRCCRSRSIHMHLLSRHLERQRARKQTIQAVPEP